MTNKTKVLIAAVTVIIAASAGVYGINSYINHSVEQAVAKAKADEAELKTYKTDAENCLKSLSGQTPEGIRERLREDFAHMDATDCTKIVDTYIYGTYNAAMQFTLSDEETDALAFATPGNACTPDLSRLEDEEMKQKFTDYLERDHIIVRLVNGQLFYDVFYGYFLDSYGDFITPEYKGLLSLYEDEKTADYYDAANNELHADIVTDRLDRIYKMLADHPSTDIYTSIEDSYIFYRSIYLGVYAQPYIFEDGSIKPDVLESYRTYAENCKDPELSSFLKELVTDYDSNGGLRTVPVYEKIKTFCKVQEASETQSET